jgi:S-(hydroxymethyl)glutathione dehydrogenase/alcohol dehydrogenase
MTDNRGADFAFEVVGHPKLQRMACDMTRPGGATVWVGVPSIMDETEVQGGMIPLQNKSIIGTMYGSADVRQDFVRFINFAKAGELDLASMVSRRIKIGEVNEAFVEMSKGDAIRSVIIHD